MSLWEQFADRKTEWIGGTLIDCGDGDPIANAVHPLPPDGARTRIVDITVTPEYFQVVGQEFACGGSRQFVAIVGASRYGDGFQLVGYGGHEWHIVKPTLAESA